MKKIFFVILILIINGISYGQYVPVYSHYMFDGSSINPAYAGCREVFSTSVFYRNQMLGLDGAPQALTLSAHAPLKSKKIALGLIFINNNIGVSNDMGLFTNYAYSIKLSQEDRKLSFGLGAGLFMMNSKWSEIVTNDANDPMFNYNSPVYAAPNFSAGIYYYTRKFFAGISLPYFLTYKHDPTVNKYKLNNGFSEFNYFFTTGYQFTVTEFLKIKPSALITFNQNKKMPLDFNVDFIYKDLLWFGASYRFKNTMVAMIGMHVNPQLSIGYSFEYMFSDLNKCTYGNHEIILRYEFGYKIEANNPRHF